MRLVAHYCTADKRYTFRIENIFTLIALRNDSTDSHSDFRSSPQALSPKLQHKKFPFKER